MAPSPDNSPYRALLALHRFVDERMRPLLTDLGLDFATESVVQITRADLQQLSAQMDPLSALLRVTGSVDDGSTSWAHQVDAPALLVAEPSLANAILGRVWRTHRAADAALTEIELAMLQRFMRDVCSRWRSAWDDEGLTLLPAFQLAGPLNIVEQHAPEPIWHVARMVVLDDDTPVGVLLFCYAGELLAPLAAARTAISWRARVERGLSDEERTRAHIQLSRLGGLGIPAPVVFRTELPLQVVGQLERGDVISLDAPEGSDMALRVLDQDVFGRIARSGNHLAVAIGTTPGLGAQPAYTGPEALPDMAPNDFETPPNAEWSEQA